jgi:YHS domain-containing protein
VIRIILLGILLIVIARAFWRLMDGIIEAAGGTSRRRSSAGAAAVKLVRDPVCGTFVAPGTSLSLTSGGATHYFCSEDCRRKFKA